MRGRSATASGLALALALTLALAAREAAAREVRFVRLDSVEDDEEVVCKGNDCLDKIWCVCNERNPLAQFRSVFGDITFTVNEGNKEAVCLRGDSSDSRLHVDVLRELFMESDKNDLQGLECEPKGSSGVVRRLRKSSEPSALEGVLANLVQRGKSALGIKCPMTASFSPYGVSCVVLDRSTHAGGKEPLELKVARRVFDWRGPGLLAAGGVLLSFAPWLSEQLFLYYASGTTIGVFLCVFLLTWFVLKRVSSTSSKNSAFVILTAEALAGLAASYAFSMLEVLVESYQNELLYYLIGSTLLSFALTYYFLRGSNGQPSGPSAVLRDLVRWLLTLVGYLCIYHSTRSLRWSLLILAALLFRNVAIPAFMRPWTGLLDFVSPSRGIARMKVPYVAGRFLTEEEYKMQGEVETQRQTRELFASPQFQEWVARNADRIHMQSPDYSREPDVDDDDDFMDDE
ncbi:Nuclear envelope integral membrane protein 1 [Hondaea fermentalgiana]|uniref:Nuclear envelope integral membrane protein 1 n=1 Tax=Hondaea fermentalgiana TaxID=2315210 RepID=A0A2R5GR71_9STRA|nr:Nuclear envelope integral membrane protein 1 [Hondaea fermentalgiana]|eukprot:GBG32258.1 Nuclear envelope integral membrane protein 1 [Hondaea fermentalgiana]